MVAFSAYLFIRRGVQLVVKVLKLFLSEHEKLSSVHNLQAQTVVELQQLYAYNPQPEAGRPIQCGNQLLFVHVCTVSRIWTNITKGPSRSTGVSTDRVANIELLLN